MKYELLPVPETPYGAPAKVAVCKSFRSAGRAYRDGCHAAIVDTHMTRLWHRLAKKAAILSLEDNKQAEAKVILLCTFLAFSQKIALAVAGFYGTDIGARMPDEPKFGVHMDGVGAGGVLGALATDMGTLVFPFIPEINQRGAYKRNDGTGSLCPSTITPSNHRMLPSFSAEPGQYLMLFEATYRMTLPHSAPNMAVDEASPRAFCYAMGNTFRPR